MLWVFVAAKQAATDPGSSKLLIREIPAISHNMLVQQLRQLEADGVVRYLLSEREPPGPTR